MIFYLLVALVGATTLVLKSDYDGPHYGTSLTIPLARTPVKRIVNVMWCSELYAPIEGELDRDIDDCRAHNLIRANLHYTADATSVTVDPTSVGGGFWQHRQADIVVHAELEDGIMLEQVLRFYPFTGQAAVPPVVAVAAEEKARPPVPQVQVVQPTAPVMLPTNGPPVAAVTAPPVVDSVGSVQPAVLILVGIGGVLLLVATVGLVMYDRRKPVSIVSDVYEFEMVDLQRQRQEDMELLVSLGTGANPAFMENARLHGN